MFDFLRRFMYGRYGNDMLNQALMLIALFFAAVWSFVRVAPLSLLVLVLLGRRKISGFSRGGCPNKKASGTRGRAGKTARPIGIISANAARPICACRGAKGKSTSNARNAAISL